jgi:hypothetical protein
MENMDIFSLVIMAEYEFLKKWCSGQPGEMTQKDGTVKKRQYETSTRMNPKNRIFEHKELNEICKRESRHSKWLGVAGDWFCHSGKPKSSSCSLGSPHQIIFSSPWDGTF